MSETQNQSGDLLSTSQLCIGCQHELKGQPTYMQHNLPTPLVSCPQCHINQPVGDLLNAAQQAHPEFPNGTDFDSLIRMLARYALVLGGLFLIIFLIIKIF